MRTRAGQTGFSSFRQAYPRPCRGAWALLLGVGADKITALHLAEHRAEYPDKRTVANAAPLLVEGVRQWLEWEQLRLEDDDFVEVTSQFASSDTSARPGTVGQAPVQLSGTP
jgi:aminoglycoside 3-N-acetyltransferase